MFKDYDLQDIKNVWFAGVHSDIGGGYPSAEAGLAKITFQWMMREAKDCGLDVDDGALRHELFEIGSPPNACADQHDSLTTGWKWAELIPVLRYNWKTEKKELRLLNRKPRDASRHATKAEVFIHQSVIDRLNNRSDYRPSNIPHNEIELRALFKIES